MAIQVDSQPSAPNDSGKVCVPLQENQPALQVISSGASRLISI
jgi:hypothetical protein